MTSSYEIFDSAIKQALRHYYNHRNYEDMYQECYMKILEVLENNTYNPIYNLYGYAYTIARNTISSYRYHDEKLTTLVAGDLVDILPIESGDAIDSDLYLNEALTTILNRYKNILPKGFSIKDLLKLLYSEDEPLGLTLTVVKGDLIWEISSK